MHIGTLNQAALAAFIGGGASLVQAQEAVDTHPEPLSIDSVPVMTDDESGFSQAIDRGGHIVHH